MRPHAPSTLRDRRSWMETLHVCAWKNRELRARCLSHVFRRRLRLRRQRARRAADRHALGRRHVRRALRGRAGKGYFKKKAWTSPASSRRKAAAPRCATRWRPRFLMAKSRCPRRSAAVKQGVDRPSCIAACKASPICMGRDEGRHDQRHPQMKGKTIGYSSPKSTTEMISTIALDRAGLTGQVQRKPVGSSSGMMTRCSSTRWMSRT